MTIDVNGFNKNIFSTRDFEYLIVENMGMECANFFRAYVEKLIKERDKARDKTQSDLLFYEVELENAHDIVNDVRFKLSELAAALSAARLNRVRLEDIAGQITILLSNIN